MAHNFTLCDLNMRQQNSKQLAADETQADLSLISIAVFTIIQPKTMHIHPDSNNTDLIDSPRNLLLFVFIITSEIRELIRLIATLPFAYNICTQKVHRVDVFKNHASFKFVFPSLPFV